MSASSSYADQSRHPLATTALVLGLLNTVCFAPAPIAWALSARVIREIDASGGRLAGRASARTGRVLGILGTLVLAAGLLVLLVRGLA